ncbi:MAG: cytochrome C oxidase subunit IV family protein [Bdellovibrionota bacterium]
MQAVIHFFKTLDAKRKSYFYVFFGLCVLTVLELAFLHLPFSQTVITIMICVASLAKALIVGWVYMHLNHETKGLKILLLFPLFVAFFYAVFLITDSHLTRTRHADPYIGMPERTLGPRSTLRFAS